MRITQRQMFSTYLGHMNTNLSQLMESNNQGGTGKRVNRPSDDPAAMGRILGYRSSLNDISRYKSNVGEASGWLNQMDHTLMQVDEVITKIKTLSLQGSTGTYDEDNREQIASQLRELMGNLLNLANTTYNGQHIFAGHKTDEPPFNMGLGVTCHDSDFAKAADFVATGGSDKSVTIQFTEDGTTAVTPGQPGFLYSTDGGTTWREGSWKAAGVMDAGGVEVTIHPPTATTNIKGVTDPIPAPDANGIITDNPNDKKTGGGTWMTVRPAVTYSGDENKIEVTQRYNPAGAPLTETRAEGYFTRDVIVRVDKASNPGNPGYDPAAPLEYSYSLDNGSTWVSAKAPNGATELAVPGGFLKIDSNGPFTQYQQFVIHPHRADINFEISPNQTITVNKVGKDIFGGLFQDPFDPYATPVNGGKNNLFETMGKLIGCAEENDSDGFGKAMDELTECLKGVTTHLADVGGRENRLDVAFQTLSMRELNEYDALSSLENIDTVELMTRLSQQQLSYNTVLKSSAMIMQMSLMNFI